ncbi:hypothetical protein [Microbispora sp. NPDC049125]|uniref:hypothetical protein n=1 Tax=Microbispora sp. NPDC049125 TaxID=3154929 RepID=UPI003465ECF9
MTATPELQSVIDGLVADIRNKEMLFERAEQDRSEHRMEVCQQQMVGLKIGLGRALAAANGKTPLGDSADKVQVSAIVRANAYLATL